MKTKTIVWIYTGFVIGFILMGMFNGVFENDDSVNGFPKSEYTKCMEAAQNRSCEIAILEAQGYTDGIDCIQEDSNPICEPIDRYNAEVDASNECFGKKPNMIDCAELLK